MKGRFCKSCAEKFDTWLRSPLGMLGRSWSTFNDYYYNNSAI